MHVRTYRARSLKEALQMVQNELGPETRIVQTRELRTGWWERFSQGRQYEIRTRRAGADPLPLRRRGTTAQPEVADRSDLRLPLTEQASDNFAEPGLVSTVQIPLPLGEPLVSAPMTPRERTDDTAASWFPLLAELIDAEVPEAAARELVDEMRQAAHEPLTTLDQQRRFLTDSVGREISTTGPLGRPAGRQQTVALVGPTGVGKTTTIAKLAAQLRLREHRRVGLITVDTYRVAAVEQLRTYADIMDLPMEVVSTPREMSAAVARLADQDVVLIDTAGHSPRDTVQLQQLKALLAEANADQTYLVVSAVSSTAHLQQIMQRFGALGATAVVITKLDEATSLGHMLPVLRLAGHPVSYLTCGQNVPDDLVVAQQETLLRVLLGQQPLLSVI